MRNVLKYYYNLSFDEIKEYQDYAILKMEEKTYIFKKFIQDEEETKYISNLLYNNGIIVHSIIINNQNSIITEYNKERYILILLNKIHEEIDSNFFYVEVPNKEIDLGTLWSNKIDYYSHQISELALGRDFLINTFNYYIGMAENAIQIYNRAKASPLEVKCCVQHRRINYPNYNINYLDPTNMLIDVRIRDISEYIKSKFFSVGMNDKEVYDLISKYNFNEKEFNMLYARLFYPTYYFDIFEDEIINEEEEERITAYLKKRTDYEKFLYNIYLNMRNFYNIFEVEWIKKEL